MDADIERALRARIRELEAVAQHYASGCSHGCYECPSTRVARAANPPSITCPRCQRASYNANDIQQRYCGACKMFHADMARAAAAR